MEGKFQFGEDSMDVLFFLKDLFNGNLIILYAGALGGLLGLLVSYKEIGKIIRMTRTSTGDIASLPADEQVEVVGTADGGAALYSPITKTPCLLWQVVVSEKRSTGKSSHWVTVYSDTSTASFGVSDGTGRVRVNPSKQMEILLRDDVSQSSGVFNSLDEQTQTALDELGVNTKGFLKMNKSMRVQERYIEQGDQIYLLGKTSLHTGMQVMDSDSPLIVSDQSELQLLGRFSWQVIFNGVIGMIIGVALSFYFTSR